MSWLGIRIFSPDTQPVPARAHLSQARNTGGHCRSQHSWMNPSCRSGQLSRHIYIQSQDLFLNILLRPSHSRTAGSNTPALTVFSSWIVPRSWWISAGRPPCTSPQYSQPWGTPPSHQAEDSQPGSPAGRRPPASHGNSGSGPASPGSRVWGLGSEPQSSGGERHSSDESSTEN